MKKRKAKSAFPEYLDEAHLEKSLQSDLGAYLQDFLSANKKAVLIGRALLAWPEILRSVFKDFPDQAEHLVDETESYSIEVGSLIILSKNAEVRAEILAQKEAIIQSLAERFPAIVVNAIKFRYSESSDKQKSHRENTKQSSRKFLDEYFPANTIRSAYLEANEEDGEPFHLYE